jgi:voltage-gated potassium channel
MTDKSRREKWEKRSEWPLTLAALVFLGGYAWPILDPQLSDGWTNLCEGASWAAWVAFLVDYVARLSLSRDRRTFFRRNLFDLAVVVLPLLRPLRLLRLVTLLTVLQRHAGASLRGRVAIYVAGASTTVILVASLAVLDVERGQRGSTIESFGDALWWAITTVTTVGYGDEFPVTARGRVIAVGLMLAGIALLGVVTATLASWLLQRVEEVEETSRTATARDIEALHEEIRELRRELRAREPTG